MKKLALLLLACGVALPIASGCAATDDPDASQDDGSAEAQTATPQAVTANEEDFATWSPLVTAAGAELNPRGMVTVLGIRGRSTDGTHHVVKSQQTYDDTFVVLLPTKRAFVLQGSTHPFQADGVDGVPDVDGDGVSDVGRIRTGQYVAVGRGSSRLVGGLPAYDVSTYPGRSGKLPGVRDTNHDGLYDETEDARSKARNDGLTAVLFHHGDRGAPAVVGCQVLPAPALKTLIGSVGGPAATFHYVLIDAPAE